MLIILAGTQPPLANARSAVQAATQNDENPPAPGFDVAGSDARAIQIADEVMRAIGGRASSTASSTRRYLSRPWSASR